MLQKKLATFFISFSLLATSTMSASAMNAQKAKQHNPEIQNIILFIGDGMSVDGITLTRWYNAYDANTKTVDTSTRLALDEMASGLVRTYWQTDQIVGAITDSAPGGTAYSTGSKTNDKYIAVSYDEKPMTTILEGAKTIGKSTGIVSTSQVMHATPADFTSHYPDRSKEEIIAEQQVYNNIDVVLGGGIERLTNRADNENLVDVLKKNGYAYVTNREQIQNANGKIWGMFAKSDLAYDMDRPLNKPDQPTLADMTQTAIQQLSKDQDGFFLMVEGSKIDWAAHANDPVGLVSEINAYDNAVRIALDFAKKDQHTMILAVTDHGNGGITIGNMDTGSSYAKDPVEKFIAPLKKAILTGEGLETKLNQERTNIKEVMALYYGITDLTDAEEIEIKETKAGSLNYTVGKMISKRAFLGWTTNGHTGEDIPLYTYLPKDERITGTLENTDIANICAGVWGLDLKTLTQKMYQNANQAFTSKGAKVATDKTDPQNPVLVVEKGNQKLLIPENKNIVYINGKAQHTQSIHVHIGDIFYVSEDVCHLID